MQAGCNMTCVCTTCMAECMADIRSTVLVCNNNYGKYHEKITYGSKNSTHYSWILKIMLAQSDWAYSDALPVSICRRGAHAPHIVAKSSSTVLNNCMYCCFGTLIYGYDVQSNLWRQLPQLEHYYDNNDGTVNFTVDSILSPIKAAVSLLKGRTMYSMLQGKWCKSGQLKIFTRGMLNTTQITLFCSE